MHHLQDNCPICKKNFNQTDDVVICPDCGAPYHRECYKKQGNCSFAHKHGINFEYKAQKQEHQENAQYQKQAEAANNTTNSAHGKLCPSCQTINYKSNIFCENCGKPLHEDTAKTAASPLGFGAFAATTPPPPPPDFGAEMDGIAKEDWASYIGSSSQTYLFRFAQLKRTGRNISFIASAFLFPSAYFAYRKMWNWSAIALIGTLLFYFSEIVWNASKAGVFIFPFISTDTAYVISVVISNVMLVINLIFSLYALSLYRKSAAKRIKFVRSTAKDDADINALIVKKGGVSVAGVLFVAVLIAGFFTGAYLLIGESVLSVFALPF